MPSTTASPDPSELFLARPAAPTSPWHQPFEIHPRAGRGWMDSSVLSSGVRLGRMQCAFHTPHGQQYVGQPGRFSLGMLLTGDFRASSPGQPVQHVLAGQAFVRYIDEQPIHESASGTGPVAGLSLELPATLAETLCAEGSTTLQAAQRQAFLVMATSTQQARQLCQLGERLLLQPAASSTLDHLALESITLELLVLLLRLPLEPVTRRASHPRWQAAINSAIDILHAEWDQPITLAALARRAGINECYLKTLFRARTGQTVQGYLRQLRLDRAHQLLRSGQYSVKEVAFLTGYSSSGRFAQAFERVHGVLPSTLCATVRH